MRRKVETALVLVLLVGLTAARTTAELPARTETLELNLAGEPWSLRLDLPAFEVDKRAALPDGSGTMIQVSSPESGVIASAFLERLPDLASVAECKKHYWPRALLSPLPKSRLSHVDTESLALVYWLGEEYKGVPVMQRNVNAYLYRDGVCVDIHLSKVEYRPEDDELFAAILSTARFADAGSSRVQAAAERFPIPAHGVLTLAVPDGWRAEMRQPSAQKPPTLVFEPREGRLFRVLVSVLWDQQGRPGYNSDQQLLLLLESALAQARPSALEEKIEIQRIEGRQLVGWYFSATDAAPEPDGFRYLTHGLAALDDLVLTFTVLSNDEQGIVAREALAMLESARKEAV